MPIPLFWTVVNTGPSALPGWHHLKTFGPWIAVIYLLKRYFGGTANTWERDMHGRVILMTGGTSGVGAEVALDLASRGAQIIFLVRSTEDQWLIEYISDLRSRSSNHLIYAEQVDLASLYSIRKFATKWLDNSPPRRLDMIICMAGITQPPFKERVVTEDGIESQWAINYLAHYHLLTLLAPALKVQPPGRDVRVILSSCSSYVLGDLDVNDLEFVKRQYPVNKPWRVFGASKLALIMFAKEFQTQFDNYKRPDGQENNVRVYLANPGFVRTASLRNFITLGSLWGLLVYLLTWPIWWLVLKSPNQGAQTHLYITMSPDCGKGNGAKSFNECVEVTRSSPKKELKDEGLRKKLWEASANQIETAEKASALRRKKVDLAKSSASSKTFSNTTTNSQPSTTRNANKSKSKKI
ncbi:hypothetical protein V1514DRAFT_337700 [Lipomyces japonicus]|uniref:uncharacterized protein n=1 Tax=Lipomyces japonicus TaxID=56871 RepID=UPI0034CE3DF8